MRKAAIDLAGRNGGWIQTYSNRQMYPLKPKVDDICILDIARALSNQCRFTGHTKRFLSVAEHSINVSYLVPEKDRLWGQLHDGSEAYLVDLAKPIKMTKQMKIFRDTEEALQRVICEKFDLPPEMPLSVKEADWLMCCTESEQLMPPKIEPWIGWVEPLDIPLMCLPPDAAMEAFLRRFLELGGKVDGVDGDAITEFFERGGTAKARRGSLRSHHPDWPETLGRDLRRRCA